MRAINPWATQGTQSSGQSFQPRKQARDRSLDSDDDLAFALNGNHTKAVGQVHQASLQSNDYFNESLFTVIDDIDA